MNRLLHQKKGGKRVRWHSRQEKNEISCERVKKQSLFFSERCTPALEQIQLTNTRRKIIFSSHIKKKKERATSCNFAGSKISLTI